MKYILITLAILYSYALKAQNLVEYELFEIHADRDTIIFTNQGSKLTLTKHSFISHDDNPITERKITLKVKELVNTDDMILEGIPTVTQEGILVSNGMILVEAYVGNIALKLNLNKTIDIEIPANAGLSNMRIYQQDSTTGNWDVTQTPVTMDTCLTYQQWSNTRQKKVSKDIYKKWQKSMQDSSTQRLFGGEEVIRDASGKRVYYIPIPIDTVWTCNTTDLSYYLFSITELGWYNIDKLLPKTATFRLVVESSEDLDLYLLLDGENICVNGQRNNNGTYTFNRVPLNKNATIIGYKYYGPNDVRMVYQKVYLTRKGIILDTSKKVTIGELKRILKRLKP